MADSHSNTWRRAPSYPSAAAQTGALATGDAPPAIDLVWDDAQRNLAEQHRRFGDLDAKLLPLLAFNVAGIPAANAFERALRARARRS